MTRRREMERRLRTLEEIRGIMGSMKNLSLMETRKLARFLTSQERALRTIETAAADFMAFAPQATAPLVGAHVYLVVGTERGFCGDFNERVRAALERHLAEAPVEQPLLIAVGRKLCAALAHDPRAPTLLDGPSVAEEIHAVLTRLVDILDTLRVQHGSLALTVLHQRLIENKDTVDIRAVLPPFQALPAPVTRFSHAPRLTLAPQDFFAGLVDHYLLAALHEMFYASLMAEHQRRVQHLEGAVRHLDEEAAKLSLKRNALRQEEIIEEIEVILLSTEALAGP